EAGIERSLRSRLEAGGPPGAVDRVRVVDAPPPPEGVPPHPDASPAPSHPHRFKNDAQGHPPRPPWAAPARAEGPRASAGSDAHPLQSRAEGDRAAFLARERAHAASPDLTEFRLLWDTLSTTYAGRPKVILDPRAAGRRQLWLADPERFGLRPPVPLTPPEPKVED